MLVNVFVCHICMCVPMSSSCVYSGTPKCETKLKDPDYHGVLFSCMVLNFKSKFFGSRDRVLFIMVKYSYFRESAFRGFAVSVRHQPSGALSTQLSYRLFFVQEFDRVAYLA